MNDRHHEMMAKVPALLRKAQMLRAKYGRHPARDAVTPGDRVEQHRSERISYAEAKAAAEHNYAVVLEAVAMHRERVRVHGLGPVDDMTAADVIAAEIIAAGELARAGGPPLPELDGVALEVINAGKRARGEIP
jgi:hypothetical protein